MARADFYLIAKPRFLHQPLHLVCELVRKAYDTQQPTLILARDQAQAEELDDLLWAFDPDAYILTRSLAATRTTTSPRS